MANIDAIVPDITAPFIMSNGNINPVWFHFFLQLFTRSEPGNNPDIELVKLLVRALYAQTNSQVQTPVSLGKLIDQTSISQSLYVPPRSQIMQLGDVPTHGAQTDEALHALVTTTLAGFMSAADKVKLNGIVAGAGVVSVGGTAPIVSSGGSTPVISITAASPGVTGSMSGADKTKLDSMTAGAAVASVSGTAPIVSSGGTAPAISITAATTVADGSMSAADKAKLDTIPGSISCFSAFQNAAQAIPAAIQTAITTYTKLFDDNNELFVPSSVFTAGVTGTYIFVGGVTGSQAVATRRLVSIFVNGVQRCTLSDNSASNGQAVALGSSPPIRLTAGDGVTLVYFSGLADTTFPGQNTTFFGGWRIK